MRSAYTERVEIVHIMRNGKLVDPQVRIIRGPVDDLQVKMESKRWVKLRKRGKKQVKFYAVQK